MTRQEARARLFLADQLDKMAKIERSAAYAALEPPNPGSFVRDIRSGKLYVVKIDVNQQQLLLDGMDDKGPEPSSLGIWYWMDTVEEGK